MNLPDINQRLARLAWRTDEDAPHIEVLAATDAAAAMLTRVCPAGVYRANAAGGVDAEAAACLECGACAVLAPESLRWEYPRGGYGVTYREG